MGHKTINACRTYVMARLTVDQDIYNKLSTYLITLGEEAIPDVLFMVKKAEDILEYAMAETDLPLLSFAQELVRLEKSSIKHYTVEVG